MYMENLQHADILTRVRENPTENFFRSALVSRLYLTIHNNIYMGKQKHYLDGTGYKQSGGNSEHQNICMIIKHIRKKWAMARIQTPTSEIF